MKIVNEKIQNEDKIEEMKAARESLSDKITALRQEVDLHSAKEDNINLKIEQTENKTSESWDKISQM